MADEIKQATDSTPIWVAIIAAVPGSIAAFLAYLSLRKSGQNAVTMQKLEISVDGKMDKLLAAREDAAGARGELKERKAEREHLSESHPPIPSTDDDPLKVKLVKGSDKGT